MGVLQVPGRARRGGLVAPRPLPRLRGGRRVLGAGGDGADARPRSSRARSRRRRARSCAACLAEHVPDAEERRWIGPRLANLLGLEERADTRPAGPVRGLAAVLRAARRREPGGAGVRGSPVGRPGAARIRRVPARVVLLAAAVRARALAPGARPSSSPSSDVAVRNSTTLALEPLSDERDDGAAGRLRTGAARRS